LFCLRRLSRPKASKPPTNAIEIGAAAALNSGTEVALHFFGFELCEQTLYELEFLAITGVAANANTIVATIVVIILDIMISLMSYKSHR